MLDPVIQRPIERRVVFANAVAGAVVLAYLMVTTSPPQDGRTWTGAIVSSTGVYVVLLAVMVGIAVPLSRRFIRRESAWMVEERKPTPEERRAVLNAPWRLAKYAFPFWVIAACLIAFGPNTGPPSDRARIFAATLLGGLVASALTFALIDRSLQETRALALAGAAPDEEGRIGLRRRLILAWALGSGIPLIGIAVTPAVRSSESPVPLAVPTVLLAIVGLVAGLLIIGAAALSISRPMNQVRFALDHVQSGNLDVELPVDAAGEVGMVQAGFNQMVAGLRERAQLQDLFGRHVGEEVARAALEQGVTLGGEQREASVFFVDLIGSSALARETSPDRVVALLNRFFAAVVSAADSEGGWVNKFEGDAALCVFGAPNTEPDHAARALRAARTLRDSLDGIEAAIGVSSGTVVAGNVGSEARYEYTVIGHPVNEASRLTDEAKRLDSRILASDAAIAAAGDEKNHWQPAGSYELRGTGRTEAWTA